MRSDYVEPDTVQQILAKMKPQNALALRVTLETGLRIGDVLKIKTSALERSRGFSVRQQKTGKRKHVKLSNSLRNALKTYSGAYYAFPGRLKHDSHRNRSTVWRDLKRACNALKINPEHVSPHSMRKIFAQTVFERTNSLEDVQKELQHEKISTSELYVRPRAPPDGV